MNSYHTTPYLLELAHSSLQGAPPPRRKVSRIRLSTIAHLVVYLLAVLCSPLAKAQSSYTATLVQPAATGFHGLALNDRGEVAGTLRDGPIVKPAIYRDGTVTALPLLPGSSGGVARSVNNVGQVAGVCMTFLPDSTVYRACLWENGAVTALPLPEGAAQSDAYDINSSGGVTGYVMVATGVYPDGTAAYRQDAVVWQGGSINVIALPWEGANLFPQAIDAFGRVAISIPNDSTGQWLPTRWTPDVPNGSTGTFQILDFAGYGFDINDSGVICGYDAQQQAVLWSGSQATVLGVLPANTSAYASSINGAGTVTGTSNRYVDDGLNYIDEFTAFVATAEGGMRDLNPLVNSASAPVGRLTESVAINSTGQILATAEAGCVILTPSTLPPPLPAPTRPSSVAADHSVWLFWNPVAIASGYNVKRATVSGGPYTTIATGVSSTSYVDRTVVNGTRYYYVVSALADTRESANSKETTAKPMAPPVAPTSLTANEAKAKVQLTWKQSKSPEIVFNRIYRSTNGGPYFLTAEIPAGVSWTDNRTVSKTNYAYMVTAVNASWMESPYSNAVAARPK